MTLHTAILISGNSRQRGVALLTALIFLVVLTLLGIGVYSTTTSEEKMARNFRDKEIALQAAEAALNEAKMLINGSYDSTTGATRTPLSADKCYSGTPVGFSCDFTLNAASLDLFSGSVTGAPLGQIGTSISPTIVGLRGGNQPRYLVIWQNPSVCGASNISNCFQIIAQGIGRLPNTRVNLVELFTY